MQNFEHGSAEQTCNELISEPDQVGRMIESFRGFIGTHMLFPDFPISQDVTYETPDGVSKKLKRVKPADKNSNISITYEDPLKGIHVDGVDEQVEEIVTFRLDFNTEWAQISK